MWIHEHLSLPPSKKICAQDFPSISWNSLWNFRHCRGISQDKKIICGNISELIYIYLLRTIKFQKNLVFYRYIIFAILRALYIKVTIVKFDIFLTLILWNISLMVSKEISFAIDQRWLILHIHYWYIM